MYVHFTMIVSFGNEGPLLILSHILPIKCITRTSEKHILIDEFYLRVTDDEHNIYLDNGDTKYGKDHIRNRRLHTKVS